MKTYNNISAEQAGIVLTAIKKAMPNRCSVLPQEILSKNNCTCTLYLKLQRRNSISPFWQRELLHKRCRHAYGTTGSAYILWTPLALWLPAPNPFSSGKPIFAIWHEAHRYWCANW